ncbi:MAG: hypothetical protein IJC18_02625, partial [Clostridia bacterium]|nr:hypothetical protein [Clostridia bacterium]
MSLSRYRTHAFCEAAVQIYLIYMAASYGLYRLVPFLTTSGISQVIAIGMAGLMFVVLMLKLRDLPLRYVAVFYLMLTAVVLSCLNAELVPLIKMTLFSDNTLKEVWVFPLAFIVGDRPEARLRQMRVAAYIGLVSYIAAMMTGSVPGASYMSFGYGSSLWWAVVAQSVF